jgi:hypothetical protein
MAQELEIRAHHVANLQFVAETASGHTVTLDSSDCMKDFAGLTGSYPTHLVLPQTMH